MAWLWNGILIPEKYCFRKIPGSDKFKKCTPDCKSYDIGLVYSVEDDEEITEVLK